MPTAFSDPSGQPPEPPQQRPGPAKARHGFRNEVSWDGGAGAQPYGNQGDAALPGPAAAHEVPEGSRGDHSGQALEQLEQARGTPP